MLLDNANSNPRVYEWLSKYTKDGEMDIVTGYFTVGTLAWLSQKTNKIISKYRFILGDITNREGKVAALNLLNAEISIKNALKLKKLAIEAVNFLKLDKVDVKTLEPNFCHAKLFLFKDKENESQRNYYITGSSNLTEAGIGLNQTSNAELNRADYGADGFYSELIKWFETLWNKPQAHSIKTIKDKKGKNKEINFKKYLIEEISKIFKEYTPKDIYLKIISEMFGETINSELEEQIKKLNESAVYQRLYDFQKKAVKSLIDMLEKYNGAILADAVGLGKTWTALAVIKFYQKQGRKIVVLVPKKLQNNWSKYKKEQKSIFETDKFDYSIRFHTDLGEERMNASKYKNERKDTLFTDEEPKLFVIDESHNLRNGKSERYKFLQEQILQKNENAKVLMLSATPINNSLLDIRNQFQLIKGLQSSLEIRDIGWIFRQVEEKYKKWSEEKEPKINDLVKELHTDFLKITNSLVVARTRKNVEMYEKTIKFPTTKSNNYYIPPNCISTCKSIAEIIDLLPSRFSAYMPAIYAGITSTDITQNESQRDFFLVRMLHILLIKRLESSWFAFYKTVENILKYHKIVLDKVMKTQGELTEELEEKLEQLTEEDDEFEEYSIGKKRKIKIKDIKNIEAYKNDLQEDTQKLQELFNKFTPIPTTDSKLEKLIEIIQNKQKNPNNNGNRKVLIFTSYTDTANYLFEQLSIKFNNIAVVSGSTKNDDIEPILQKFAPKTKLLNELEDEVLYQKVLKEPIDILIATDVLSEGQNLQDADMVVNYDIHWNPVKIIQRIGRIDRIGSNSTEIFSENFWASDDAEEFLNLKKRVEKRMVAMTIAGSEILKDLTESLNKMTKDNVLEELQAKKNLEIMKNSLADFEGNEAFGFSHLTLDDFRSDLASDTIREYKELPNGIFSGFIEQKNGIVALLKYRNEYKLIFIDLNGNEILQNNNEILSFLKRNQKQKRSVSKLIDECDEKEIKKYADALGKWIESQKDIVAPSEIKKIFASGITEKEKNKEQEKVEEKYVPEKWELVCWEVIQK
jgi:ERCC4-related helicase